MVEDRDTILELTGKMQELQNEINCMNDLRDFQDAESIRSGQSHVTSRPVSFPLHPIPEGMLSRSFGVPSRKNGPPSIWDTHGISGNVFANPTASSSAPFPKELHQWNASLEEPLHSSTVEQSERQKQDQDLKCHSGPSAKNSVIFSGGDSSKNYGADQQRLQISDLRCNIANTQLYLYASFFLFLCLYLWLQMYDVYVYVFAHSRVVPFDCRQAPEECQHHGCCGPKGGLCRRRDTAEGCGPLLEEDDIDEKEEDVQPAASQQLSRVCSRCRRCGSHEQIGGLELDLWQASVEANSWPYFLYCLMFGMGSTNMNQITTCTLKFCDTCSFFWEDGKSCFMMRTCRQTGMAVYREVAGRVIIALKIKRSIKCRMSVTRRLLRITTTSVSLVDSILYHCSHASLLVALGITLTMRCIPK